MSRSNPTETAKNPATRWFEWKSNEKEFAYYDKEEKKLVPVKLPFTFILLDQTKTIRGYSKKQKSGIFANEVRDTVSEPLVAKFFNDKTPFATGLWTDIKDKVVARSGKFAVNCYIAFKDGDEFKLGAIQLVGCSLGPWFDFTKAHGKLVAPPFNKDGKKIREYYAQAITVKKSAPGTTGDVEFNSPVFELAKTTAESDAQAVALDMELQEYFDGYFKKGKVEQSQHHEEEPESEPEREQSPEPEPDEVPEGDDVPF